ncbi:MULTISPECIES: DNA-directed RNA polymerase subunit A' [Halobacterium]|uniref:DNA-directed RNA polymerase subunit A' n=1 Tax=Halobacterium TaxID=2239 RepID=UPI001963265C|nr:MULTISPECIES: DNA-directed RNA polymerase subunit A' [Halobacterium]MCF2164645.1 DNA-directed RNA polymerase subunit A' [Halobacterium salinarum]MCF2166909.1 DNA-directed RNA polymerase subunit A' [Halobacterium salinarum]MDL0125807.1 DNA-directed RNA polymerase subunit A' [Halobacterium salinarum]QRY22752.1 DNA-directed RNA polymerase subunit A' [Halobacterium sp. GSL-19]WOY07715.1 DNA-directed RNA polymerase subunit A' [Halobacterium salinarum]
MSAGQAPKEIGEISFGLMDPEEYRDMSATKVITADTYDDDGFPIDMGLMDPRLGVIDPGLECKTCGQRSGGCNGHFGHIELAAPVIHVGFSKLIRRLLRGTCRECASLLLTEEEKDEYRENLDRTRSLRQDVSDVMTAAIREARKKDHCPHCGEVQYDVKHEKPTTYYEVQQVLASDYSERIAASMQPDEEEDDAGVSPQELAEQTDIDISRINEILSGEFRPRREDREAIETAIGADLTTEDMNKLMPSDIRDWFEDIPGEDLEALGVNSDRSRPEWMILTVLPVPPVTARPSITLDNGQRSEDDLTHKLVDIIRINQRFMENREAGAPQLIIEDLWELLQYHVTTFMDNEISGTPPARHRSGRPLKTLSQRLKGKEGRFRGSLSGKRVNFSARTVISPDPTLSLNEVGVPDRVATEMTQTMVVNEQNLERARRYVRNGPEGHPGANYVTRPDGRRVRVTEKVCEELAERVEPGWEVQRHLIDGDIIIFNRQPSLHRMSIMAHEVVVMPYKTFRLNTVVCPPYNADFDGDEMNMHALQNEEARAEARVLMRVQEQILSPRFGENIIGAIQDHISGTYLLTNDNPRFNETQASDLLRQTRIDELPAAAGTDEDGDQYWTGHQIFSELLPDDLSLEFTGTTGDTVVIEDGQLLEGTIADDEVGEYGSEIVDTITKVHGNTRARIFINEVASLAMRSIMHFGFSIGIDDETVSTEARERIDEAIQSAYDRVQELIETYENGDLESLPGRTVDETLEMKIMQTLGKARDSAGDVAEENFDEDNPAVVMANSGARGSMLNLTQMAGCVGQQAVRGERINRGYEDRTLSHFAPNDLSSEAHGFVENSYTSGLTPKEFFFHAMGGREGLVDTAVRTSKSGYLQRRLINALSELETQYDGTVRDTSDTIVQFEFGEDGTSPVQVSSNEEVDIDVEHVADRILNSEFDSDTQKAEFLEVEEPPTNLSEHGAAWEVESDD